MANSTESSSQNDRDSPFRKANSLGLHNGTNPHHSCGYELNPNTAAALKIMDTSVREMSANSSKSTKDIFEKQQKSGCLSIPDEAQHYDIGPLLSRMDRGESRKRPNLNGLSQASKNCEFNASANLLGPLQSSSPVLDDPNFQLTYSRVSKRPRTADIYLPHDPPTNEANFTNEPSLLKSSLKRLCREELERIIMGHMAGYVTIYKPYVDMEQELDSCKEKVERLRQKNDLLSKEVADLRSVVKSFVTQSATRFERPIKKYRTVGVQVKPSTAVKFEEKDLQAHFVLNRSEEGRPVFQREAPVLHHPEFERNGKNIPQKKFRDTETINERQRSMTDKTEDAKAVGDDLMVMFVKPSNPVPVNKSATEDTIPIPSCSTVSTHPAEAILPKPVVTVTKTVENSIPAIRIAWEIPEKQRCAKVASYCVFLLKETRNGYRESWNPITGDILRMSCTFRMGRADKLRSSYQFKVRAVDVNGQHSPFSDVVVANFP